MVQCQAPKPVENAAVTSAPEQTEDEETPFKDLDVITKHGITKTDVNKFKEAGFQTVESVAFTVRKVLLNIKGITEAKLDKVFEAIAKERSFSFRTGTEHLVMRQKIKKISTGCKAVDKILGGGLESASITEIYGEFRCGKTQWVHTLAVTSMLPVENGGGGGKVAIIDTENGFRSDKIQGIADRFEVDADAVLDNMIVARAYNSDHQMQLIKEVAAAMMNDGPYSLLIVDSMTALFRTDYVGRGELSVRQQVLGQMCSKLMKIAEEFNVAVLITNQVMSNPDGAMTFVSDPKKPVGGHVLAHASTTRLELKKGRGDTRICKIIDSPSQPEAEATFQITSGGVADPAE